MRQIGKRFFTRPVTIWPCTIDDTYGDLVWGQPVLLKCWFISTNEFYKNSNGEEKVAKYKIIMGADAIQHLGDTYYLAVDKDLTAEPDPTLIPNTFAIGSWGNVAADSIGSQDVVIVMV